LKQRGFARARRPYQRHGFTWLYLQRQLLQCRAARGETREIRQRKKLPGQQAAPASAPAGGPPGVGKLEAALAPVLRGPPSFPPMPMARALRTRLDAPHLKLEAPAEPPADSLEESLARTGRSLRAAMALLWLDDDHGGGLHGYFGWDAALVPMVGTPEEWAPFRRMASTAPVLIQDARKDKVLSRSPLVAGGLVGCFAGAPVPDARGERAGVLWIVQDKPGGLVPDVLEPLTVWAQHLGADLVRLPLPGASAEGAANDDDAPHPAQKHGRRGHASVLDQQTAFEAASLAVDYGILITDSGGRIAASNRAALKMLGLKNRRLTGLNRARLLERLRLDGKLDASQAARLLRASAALDLELKVGPAPERVLRWELRHLRIGRERCLVDRVRDVTDVRAQQLENSRLQRVDALTWLGNRAAFNEALAAEISRALRMNTPLSLALFSIDGHAKLDKPLADRVLRDVAWVLADLKRGYDPAARFEDGTLAVILPGATAKAALVFGGRVVEDARDLEISDLPRITLSGGITEFDRTEDVDAILARARAAMLEAAACGGNGVL
jgi:diguanylate cyclase (GGDEF)-like protein